MDNKPKLYCAIGTDKKEYIGYPIAETTIININGRTQRITEFKLVIDGDIILDDLTSLTEYVIPKKFISINQNSLKPLNNND